MKYIVSQARDGTKTAHVFSESTPHDIFASRHGLNPVSAGFCERISTGAWQAYGESLSLGIQSAEGDSELLEKLLDW